MSPQSHSLAFTAELPEENLSFYIVFNVYLEPLEFELPRQLRSGAYAWRQWIDTSLESRNDIQDWRRLCLPGKRIAPALVR